MKSNKFFKKGQSLPLNTIIIAILVILVLVFIILYFTTGITKTGEDMNSNQDNINACEVGSFLISEEKYDDARNDVEVKLGCSSIQSGDWVKISGAKANEGYICCARKKGTYKSSSDR